MTYTHLDTTTRPIARTAKLPTCPLNVIPGVTYIDRPSDYVFTVASANKQGVCVAIIDTDGGEFTYVGLYRGLYRVVA